MSVITKHPQKEGIDALIKSNQYSYRELEKELKSRFGLSVSFKTIQAYHSKELGGIVDVPNNETGEPTGEVIALDMTKIAALVSELTISGKGTDKPVTALKTEIAELFAIQLQITKHALLQHTKGTARYPSEYVKNLQIFSNLMLK